MKLLEALEILKRPLPPEAPRFAVMLACGFTPLHLKTYLAAKMALRLPIHRMDVQEGLFGDLAGTLERCAGAQLDAVGVIVEWPDLDPRLGIRTLGGWRNENVSDIVESVLRQVERLASAVRKVRIETPVAVSMPTLPLPPLFSASGRQATVAELRIRQAVASFAANLSTFSNVRVVSAQRLDETSPLTQRFDVRSELSAGFPYKNAHACVLAESLAALICNPTPKKGLITDLDDTFWAGILGEMGAEGVAWDLQHSAQAHGIYQQFLSSLASAGVLLAIASKNTPELVNEVFLRKDILCSASAFFPLEVHWQPKSESVDRILKAWNIGPEAVVFVDDSPMEAAEVQSAHPQIECLTFPRNDPDQLWRLLEYLRDLFGKPSVQTEDALRLDSLRSARLLETAAGHGHTLDAFLADAQARVEFSVGAQPDERALELINKTNQFNLNGRRWEAAALNRYLSQSDAFLLTTGYSDKYGPLGKIAALLGRRTETGVAVDAWVMSCRAFSRRIEHQSLRYLFDKYDAEKIQFDFFATARNSPLREFFDGLLGRTPAEKFEISRADFEKACPALFHHVELR
jgi:FkbH-like protein